ncbi:MAG TPA: hypothetical protein VLV86_19510 [Vicinamibacterales bacterium]|nr:hypothetical protein [Vicinamibacterales bacterium]
MHAWRPSAILIAALLAATGGAHAQTQRSGGDSQRALQQLQQLATERASAQADAAKAKQALADANKQVGLLTAERDRLKAQLSAVQTEATTATSQKRVTADELEQTKRKLAELIERFRDTANSLRTVESERTATQSDLVATSREYERCASENLELSGIALEALSRYERAGPFSRLGRAEPFTRIAQTRAENLADEYRARVEELKVKKVTPPPPAAPGAPPRMR